MDAADLGAVHLVAGARRAGRCVERAQSGVGLLRRIGVDAGLGAHTAVAAAACGGPHSLSPSLVGPHPLSPSPCGRGGTWRLIVVLEARHVATAVALVL